MIRGAMGVGAMRLVRQVGRVVGLVCVTVWAVDAHGYPAYDDGSGSGCVQCHDGFQGGTGPLHFQHRTRLGVATCNLCHPAGGGSTPVLTYSSGPGGGLGCAGCHGQDYGETSPHGGQPKATAYGLRRLHVSRGVASCGTSACHTPGVLGHSDPFPPAFGEDVPPPYYAPAFSGLVDPCSSADEDMPLDADAVGLDNDGDGVADGPGDADCAAPVTTTTTSTVTTTTVPFACPSSPAAGCIAAGKGLLLVHERRAGRERWKLSLRKLETAVARSQFGDPVSGSTAYAICIYDGANELRGQYTVARAGDTCGDDPCWSGVSDRGYRYGDRSLAADGVRRMHASGGSPGTGKLLVVGRNGASTMPTGVAAALQGEVAATVQLLASDASCFALRLVRVKKADGTIFSAVGP